MWWRCVIDADQSSMAGRGALAGIFNRRDGTWFGFEIKSDSECGPSCMSILSDGREARARPARVYVPLMTSSNRGEIGIDGWIVLLASCADGARPSPQTLVTVPVLEGGVPSASRGTHLVGCSSYICLCSIRPWNSSQLRHKTQ
jgi:hypothetical protein